MAKNDLLARMNHLELSLARTRTEIDCGSSWALKLSVPFVASPDDWLSMILVV